MPDYSKSKTKETYDTTGDFKNTAARVPNAGNAADNAADGTPDGIRKLLSLFGITGTTVNIKSVAVFFLMGCSLVLFDYILERSGFRGVGLFRKYLLQGFIAKAIWVAGLVSTLVFVKSRNVFLLSLWVAGITTTGYGLLALLYGNLSMAFIFLAFAIHFLFTLMLIMFLTLLKQQWVALGAALFTSTVLWFIGVFVYYSIKFHHIIDFPFKLTHFIALMGKSVIFALVFQLCFKLFNIQLQSAKTNTGFSTAYSVPQAGLSQSTVPQSPAPRATDPQFTESRPAEPYSTESQLVEPLPTELQPTASESGAIRPGAPFSQTLLTEDTDEDVGGFFGPEKRAMQKGPLGGLAMMVIAAVWFFAGLAGDVIFYYPPILFVIGLYGFIKGLVSKDLTGEKRDSDNMFS
ncbi:MAG: hypothetical protein GY765_15715 [bacterium]|nr:hypothetical protein [bacterium]